MNLRLRDPSLTRGGKNAKQILVHRPRLELATFFAVPNQSFEADIISASLVIVTSTERDTLETYLGTDRWLPLGNAAVVVVNSTILQRRSRLPIFLRTIKRRFTTSRERTALPATTTAVVRLRWHAPARSHYLLRVPLASIRSMRG